MFGTGQKNGAHSENWTHLYSFTELMFSTEPEIWGTPWELNSFVFIYRAYVQHRPKIWGTQWELNSLVFIYKAYIWQQAKNMEHTVRIKLTYIHLQSLILAQGKKYGAHSENWTHLYSFTKLMFDNRPEIWGTQWELNSLIFIYRAYVWQQARDTGYTVRIELTCIHL